MAIKTSIYDVRRYGKLVFLVAAAAVVVVFLWISTGLVDDLKVQERERMEIWADATKEILNVDVESPTDGVSPLPQTNIVFLLSILERNTTIPVLLADDEGNILQHRNFTLPEPQDPDNPLELSPENEKFLKRRLKDLAAQGTNTIEIAIAPGINQHLYYEDSTLLKRLNYFPYIQIIVMLAFVLVVYYAVLSTKKAEQNKVWVGLSKETAHQLGTPISSLMAWVELLKEMNVGDEVVTEMNKDVKRLETIASRFSKIGSKPTLEHAVLDETVGRAVDYMRTRISGRIALDFHPGADTAGRQVMLSTSLFEWVMENLIKNAVDAMEGQGRITVTTGTDKGQELLWVEVEDTGRGISRKQMRNVFSPGFTTKKRGWGLGLTLARRIIEAYHDGRIFVKESVPGVGTTFRIELKALNDNTLA